MVGVWIARHWLRVAWVVGVTTAMILSHKSLIPVWIFYTLLIAMHVWIFSKIGLRVYGYLKTANKKKCG